MNMTQRIYLDNSTTTHPSPLAVRAMMPYFTEMWGVPSSPHQMGQELFGAIQDSYRSIYTLLGASEDETFVFTSSGPEAINQVIQTSWVDISLATGKNHYMTSAIDEAPSIMAIGRIEHLGAVGKMIKPNHHGILTTKAVAEAITPRTALLSLSWGNGLTGVIQPIEEIAALCRDRGIKLHLDITHALGKIALNFKEFSPDFLTFNGDTLHAPKGTGGLLIKKGVPCGALIVGGIEQGGMRAGHLNVPGLVALGCAANELGGAMDYMGTEIARLRDYFESAICDALDGAVALFKDQHRLPHISAIGFPGVVNEALLFLLSRKGICASIGGGSFQRIDLVLQGAGVDSTLAQGAVSFSLSRETTEDEIERAIPLIIESVKELRRISGG